MLAGKGYQVYNISGGIKKWDSPAAYGLPEQGLELFSGHESPQETLTVAFALEEGLREFYLSMRKQVQNNDVKQLFSRLAAIEVKHQERLLNEYNALSGEAWTREAFAAKQAAPAMEGGLTTAEYLRIFDPDLESTADIVSLAMSIEAQAFDLYQRAAEIGSDPHSRSVLKRIAEEERTHMAQLGKLMAQLSDDD